MTLLLPLLLTACGPSPVLELSLAPNVSTVVLARWSSVQDEPGRLRWGEADSTEWLGERTEHAASTEHELLIAGLHPETSYRFDVEIDGAWLDEPEELETGAVPSRLAPFEVQPDPDAFEGFLPMPMIGVAPGVTVVDASGEVVWYYSLTDASSQPRRAWYLPDQQRFLLNAQDADDHQRLISVSLDGATVEELDAEGHHDFLLLPDGDLLLIAEDARTVDGQEVIGDSLVRQGPDGSRTTVWSVWDHFDPSDQAVPADGDWTHANALDYLPDRDLVLLGLRHFDSVLALDGSSFELQWALGGRVGSLALDAADGPSRQHQFQLLDDDHLLLFDNRSGDEDSRLVEYALDLQAGSASLVWSHHHDPPVQVDALGNIERTPDGRTIATWTTAGEVQVLDEDGAVLWQLNTLMGTGVGYGDRFDSF